MLKVNSSLLRVIESSAYGRLTSLVGSKNIPDLILHIIGCRILNEKDLFTVCLYFVVNGLPYDLMKELFDVNGTLSVRLDLQLTRIWQSCLDFNEHPNWFTYVVSKGGVYYIDGRKKFTSPLVFNECDPHLVHEFFNSDFEWEDFALIWDPSFGYNGGYRMWRRDRELPVDAYWAVGRGSAR